MIAVTVVSEIVTKVSGDAAVGESTLADSGTAIIEILGDWTDTGA